MLRLAILDMYDNEPNQGIGMIKAILNRYSEYLRFDRFDVRYKNELPGLDYDAYIFTGGPGHPTNDRGPWWDGFFDLIDALWKNNQNSWVTKKQVFFICHSFQLACHHFKVGEITSRTKMSFGTYPIYRTAAGKKERFFNGLPEPFYIADFRYHQVINPNKERLEQLGAEVLAFETLSAGEKRPRAMMAIRFSPEIFATQFHPEANDLGMLHHFEQDFRKKQVEDLHGAARYKHMIHDLKDPKKIKATFSTILPRFIEHAIRSYEKSAVPAWTSKTIPNDLSVSFWKKTSQKRILKRKRIGHPLLFKHSTYLEFFLGMLQKSEQVFQRILHSLSANSIQ